MLTEDNYAYIVTEVNKMIKKIRALCEVILNIILSILVPIFFKNDEKQHNHRFHRLFFTYFKSVSSVNSAVIFFILTEF